MFVFALLSAKEIMFLVMLVWLSLHPSVRPEDYLKIYE